MRNTTLRSTHKRQHKKRLHAQRDRTRERAKARADRFPNYTICAVSDAPPQLVQAVAQAVKAIRRHPDRHLGDWAPAVLQAKRDGFRTVRESYERQAPTTAASDEVMRSDEFMSSIAEAITTQLPKELIDGCFPECWFYMCFGRPRPNTFKIEFQTLRSAKTPGGTAYYSRKNPKITVNGKQFTVAFFRHAMERIGERAFTDRSYLSLKMTFDYFDEWTYFQPCQLASGDTAIAICKRVSCHHKGPDPVNRTLFPTNDNLLHRVGYAPLVFHENLAVAKTFLPCGMRGTPEDRILRFSNLTAHEREEQRTKIIDFALRGWFNPEDVQILEWFAEQGHRLVTSDPSARKHRPTRRRTAAVAPISQEPLIQSLSDGAHACKATANETVEGHSIEQFAL